jgi:hypothetical protein
VDGFLFISWNALEPKPQPGNQIFGGLVVAVSPALKLKPGDVLGDD